MQQMAQAKMLQNPMQRDGSNMEMGGQRSNSPGSMDNAPSPSKRPRLEGGNGFNGQQMGPAGRGQSISVSQMNNLNAAAGPNAGMMLPNGVPDLQQQQLAFAGQTASMQQKQMEVMNANLPQGSQLPGAAMDGIDFSTINGGRMGAAGANQTGNHALQDYQMQLMLLEQQNKKRLLMARQEQDNMVQSHAGSGANPQFAMAASMSPSQSRAGGPSPNPNEMKRVASTPKLGQGVPGSPMPDMQNRGSPAPGFDPNQIVQGMHPAMYNQMAAGMARPPSSHPGAAFPMGGLTQQNIEAIRRNGGLPNGQPFPQGGPQMLQQNMQNPQQPPPQINTPQQRHGTMPPPRAPASQEPQRTQPSSPAQNQAPQTPSQNPKSVPKGKKENKAAAKVCFELATFPLIRTDPVVEKSEQETKHHDRYTGDGKRRATNSNSVYSHHSSSSRFIQQTTEWQQRNQCAAAQCRREPSATRPDPATRRSRRSHPTGRGHGLCHVGLRRQPRIRAQLRRRHRLVGLQSRLRHQPGHDRRSGQLRLRQLAEHRRRPAVRRVAAHAVWLFCFLDGDG